jgi:acetylornithine/N-succinyldiaminopimelate aminotransferase
MPNPSLSFDSLMEITVRPPIVFVEGKGSWLRDQDGKRYLDFIQGWAVNCLGHCPKPILEALEKQASRLINCSPAFYNEPMIRLADLITANSCLDKVFFCNSGAEANEGAVKIARKWGTLNRNGAHEIITMDHSFHGRTLTTMAASGKPEFEALYEPKTPGFFKVPLNDLEAVKRKITDKTVAVMLEPIQGEAGVHEATVEFLQGLRELTKKENLLLILDEVQTGIGRTGRLFAYEHYGIEPDVMTLGKGLGGGVPLAALVAKDAVCCFKPGDQGGTFNGNSLVSAVGCGIMETILQPGFLDAVVATGRYLKQRLEALSEKFGFGEVRGRGMLLALNLKQEIGKKISEISREKGLLVNSPGPDNLRFMPALNVTREEIDQMIEILTLAITAALKEAQS